jgi:hypothetical protein
MDPYKILNLKPGFTENELKQAYKAALLRTHPDKQPQQENIKDYRVDMVIDAYQSLLDPVKRNLYTTLHSKPTLPSEIVDLDDMDVQEYGDGLAEWSRKCRCGAPKGYLVTEQDLIDNQGNAEEVDVQCIGCSIWIKVVYAFVDE